MLEMRGTVTAVYRSICLVDDPASDAAYPDVEVGAEDVDDYLPPPDPPEGFDLLTAAPGVVTVTTGAIRGQVDLTIRVLDDEPSALAPGIWDAVEEIGFRALSGYTMPASGEYYPFPPTARACSRRPSQRKALGSIECAPTSAIES